MLRLLSILIFSATALQSQAKGRCPKAKDCDYLGSFVISPSGLQKMVKLSLDRMRQDLKSEVKDSFSKEISKHNITFYETPKNCQSSDTGKEIKQLLTQGTSSAFFESKSKTPCFLYPVMGEDISDGQRIRLVPVRISMKETRVHDFDFNIKDPKCQGHTCHIQSELENLKFTGNIIVQSLDPKDRKKSVFESPAVLIEVKKGGAIIDTEMTLGEKNNLHSLQGQVHSVKLDTSQSSIKPIILDPFNGQPMDKKKYRSLLRDVARNYRSRKMKARFKYDPCSSVVESSTKKEEEFVEKQISTILDQKSGEGLSDEELDELGHKIETSYKSWKTQLQEKVTCVEGQSQASENMYNDLAHQDSLDQCQDFRCYSNYLPYGKLANNQARLDLEGFSNSTSEKLFKNMVNLVGRETLKTPEINSRFTEVVQDEAPKVNKHIQETLKATGEMLDQSLLDQKFATNIPTLDLAALMRSTRVDGEIEDLEKRKKILESSITQMKENSQLDNYDSLSIEQMQFEMTQKELKQLKKIKQQLEKDTDKAADKEMMYLQAVFQQTDNFNRYGLFASQEENCLPPKKKLSDQRMVANDQDLQDVDFALDVPLSTVERHLLDIWKRSPEICLDSYEDHCDEKVLQIKNPPKIKWNPKTQAYDILIEKAQAKNLSFFVKDQDVDMKLSARFASCPQKNKVCLQMSNAQVKRRTGTGWRNLLALGVPGLVLDSKISGDIEDLNKALEEPIELEVSPPPFTDEIKFGNPIHKENGFMIPIQIDNLPEELFQDSPEDLP